MDGWDPTWLDAIAAAGHRVVIFDNEGVGRSTAARGPLTIRRMGDTTAGLIARPAAQAADVAGWSMGGMIAQSLAVRHPRLAAPAGPARNGARGRQAPRPTPTR